MSLTLQEVERIAKLAHLEVSGADLEATQAKLNSVFSLIEAMQAVDTTGVAPMSHPQDLTQRLRRDVASEQVSREAFQAIAPQAEAGLYLVPKVIE